MSDLRPIGIVVKTWPKLSETFILEELLGLERQGVPLHIFALQSPTDHVTHPEVDSLRSGVSYIGQGLLTVLLAHLQVLIRHPFRYVGAFASHVRSDDPTKWAAFRLGAPLALAAQRTGVATLHAHFISEPAAVAEAAALLMQTSYSVSAHAKDIYLSDDRSLRRRLAGAAFTVTCTEHNRRHLERLAPAGVTVQCVHHGVETTLFEPSGPAADDDVPVVLAVGRLREKKGLDVLIDACAELRDRGVDIVCRIVGYGPERARLVVQAQRLGVSERVEFLGKLTRPDVIAQYQSATLVAQPCRVTSDGDRDGIPNVLLEAMAMGLPVVSTPISGIPEVVEHDVNGLLVSEGSPSELADALESLLASPGLRRRLGAAARATIVDRFTVDMSAAAIARRLAIPRVAYVVKGFPRLSELFIATEIHRIEQLGTPLELMVLKQPDEEPRHKVVSQLLVSPRHLPAVSSISRTPAWRWLVTNWRPYAPALLRVAMRSPLGFGRASGHALGQAWRARRGKWPRKRYLKEFFHAAYVADAVLRSPNIRHLHAHFCHGATTVTWLASTMSRRSFSFTAHAKDIYKGDLNPAGLLERKLAAASFVATCTEANRRYLLALAPTASVETIYHGLNEEFAQLVAAREGGAHRRDEVAPSDDRDVLRILAVGRLVAKKGLDVLIDAVALLHDAGLTAELTIIGEAGAESERLRHQTVDLGLDRAITFLGGMNQRQLFERFTSADVFALPCRILEDGDRDGIPNVLMEAMAVGLPVVSTAISGIPELVEHRSNGLLVEPDDADALAKALAEVHADADLRDRLGREAAATISERFDGWSSTRRLIELFESEIHHA